MSVGTSTLGAVDPALWPACLTQTRSPLSPGERVLAVAAHPDDETIGAGRLLAGHDGPVRAVTLTAGEHCMADAEVASMGPTRLAEWRSALEYLGVEPLDATRWADGRLASFEDEAFALLAELLVDVDVVVAVWAGDPHPDHQAAGRAARRACAEVGVRLVEYPVWAPLWLTPDDVAAAGAALRTVSSSNEADRAWSHAIAEYATQILPLRPGWLPVVPQELLDRHRHQLVVAGA